MNPQNRTVDATAAANTYDDRHDRIMTTRTQSDCVVVPSPLPTSLGLQRLSERELPLSSPPPAPWSAALHDQRQMYLQLLDAVTDTATAKPRSRSSAPESRWEKTYECLQLQADARDGGGTARDTAVTASPICAAKLDSAEFDSSLRRRRLSAEAEEQRMRLARWRLGLELEEARRIIPPLLSEAQSTSRMGAGELHPHLLKVLTLVLKPHAERGVKFLDPFAK